eukprot:CAMPEP_0177660808 /NCGR_PEP_ID=MMETSP0447-20121125/18270_1 /TAXON_ID=0 /ORGANISM="Stygamoeba regulata, Strain BSH-02190019" /LENGTH=335 /DNA_ID=CAMNT_0019165963 /DNA_START=44 /DNA_END=1054 /DNA_ORIENTATION=-
MTHSSGIGVATELADKFGSAITDGTTRFVKAVIENESVVLKAAHAQSDNFQADVEAIQGYLEDSRACYIFLKLDSPSSSGATWRLLAYVPDTAPVKERMLYASSRDFLKKQLGSSYFADDLHGTTKADLSWESYQAHINSKTSAAPLTSGEALHQKAASLAIDPGHTREYVHSVKFPMSRAAFDEVRKLGSGDPSTNFVQLLVDPAKETIELACSKKLIVSELASAVPSNEPRFSLFSYDHVWEGQQQKNIVFIYSCTNHSPVKLKMLYSTVKAPAIQGAEEAGVEKMTRIEVQEPEELNEALLNESIHPKVEEKVQRITRPTRPGKGAARLVRK